jgi:hypothetical protein
MKMCYANDVYSVYLRKSRKNPLNEVHACGDNAICFCLKRIKSPMQKLIFIWRLPTDKFYRV